MLFPFICFVLVKFTLSNTEIEDMYSSVDSMKSLVFYERQLVPTLRHLQETLSTSDDFLHRYLKEFDVLSSLDADAIVRDPIASFQLLRRLTVNLLPLAKMDAAFQLPIEELPNVPTRSDLIGAAKNLVQLQSFYQIPVEDFANGKLKHFQSLVKLTAEDCYIISQAVKLSVYGGDENKWKHVAKTRFDNGKPPSWLKDAMKQLQPIIKQNLQKRNYHKPGSLIPEEQAPSLWSLEGIGEMDYNNYILLCNGHKLLTPLHEVSLKCVLSHRSDPFYYLMPLKTEVVSNHPLIYIFYDVITDREIRKFQEIARPDLERSLVLPFGRSSEKLVRDDSIRISKHSWITDEESPHVATLSERVGRITRFNCAIHRRDCEAFQVVNYGIGGQYNVHWDESIDRDSHRDHFLKLDWFPGKRIATFMFYLTDVEVGGYTVFPRAGVSVKPIKGSAVFWYNLFPNGTTDKLSLHGGCPVLYGSKWVANKWIYEKSQMFLRPCKINKMATL